MAQEFGPRPQNLKLHTKAAAYEREEAVTPNSWWVERYPDAYENHGSPFLELKEPADQFSHNILPITINHEFFAAVLGGRKDLGHHVVYYEPELAWYYRDWDGIYRTTPPDKLANLYRGLMMKCAQDMPPNVHKLNLVQEFRSDRVCKSVVQRAKSINSADASFFSPTSPHQRIAGPEIHERIGRVFCEQILEREPGHILTVGQAYKMFTAFAAQRNLPPLKRSMFKPMISEIIRCEYDLGVRNDLINTETDRQQCGWKGLRAVAA